MQQFEITLKNDKLRLYDRLNWFIILLNIALLVYISFFATEKIRTSNIVLLAALVVVFFLRYYFKNTKYQYSAHPFYFLLLFAWINNGNYWLAGAMLLFDILRTFATRKLVVHFSNEGIVYPSFPKKNIPWANVSNIILKDGLLTINLTNNRFFQQYIDESNNAPNEKDFNDFCRTRR